MDWMLKWNVIKNHPVMVFTFLVALFIALPFVLFNHGQTWDSAGHYFSAYFTAEHLFPSFFGWNPFQLNGFPQNYFYAPVFYWIVSLFSLLIPLSVAFLGLVAVSFLLVPFAADQFAQSFGVTDLKRRWTFLTVVLCIMVLPSSFWTTNGALGGDFYSTLNVGLVTAGWWWPLFLLSVARIQKDLDQGLRPLTVLLGALTIGFHIMGLLLIPIGAFLVVGKKTNAWKRFGTWTAGLLALNAFFLVHFIEFTQFYQSTAIWPDMNRLLLLSCVIGFGLVAWQIEKKQNLDLAHLFVGLTILLTIGVALNASFHLYRLVLPLYVIIALMMVQEVPNKLLYPVMIGSIVLMAFSYPTLNIESSGSLAINETFRINSAQQGTVLFLPESLPPKDHHAVGYALTRRQGIMMEKGLMVESSPTARFVSTLERGMNRYAFTWGGKTDEGLYPTDQNQKEKLIREQFRTLGIGFIVTDLNLDENGFSPTPPLIATQRVQLTQNPTDFWLVSDWNEWQRYIGYHLVTLEPVPMAETITQAIEWDNQEFENEKIKWFMDENRITHVLVNAQPAFEPAVKKVPVSFSWGAHFQSFELHIDSNEDVPVLVRQNYFPAWKATVDGKETAIYQSAPNFMVVNTHGTVHFSLEPTVWEKVANLISVIALLIVLWRLFQWKK